MRNLLFKIKKLYYRIRHKEEIKIMPSMGNGKYTSINRKGNILYIVDNHRDSFTRVIPHKENHGVFVENWSDGKLMSRYSINRDDFRRNTGSES